MQTFIEFYDNVREEWKKICLFTFLYFNQNKRWPKFLYMQKTVEFFKIYMLIAIEISRDAQNFVS